MEHVSSLSNKMIFLFSDVLITIHADVCFVLYLNNQNDTGIVLTMFPSYGASAFSSSSSVLHVFGKG